MGVGSRIGSRPTRRWILLLAALALLAPAAGSPQRLERLPGRTGGAGAQPPIAVAGAGAWLGVEVTQADVRDRFGGRERVAGVLVTAVVADSPADRAGLERGDLIVGIGGTEVDSPDALLGALARHEPGSRVRLDWLRSGRGLRSVARLGERPGRGPRVPVVAAGIEVRSVQARISPLPGGGPRRALLVTGRLDGGRGSPATLAPGDIVDEVNRRMIGTPQELEAALDAMSPGAAAIVRRIRGMEVSYVPLAVGGMAR